MRVFLATTVGLPGIDTRLHGELVKYIESKHTVFHFQRDLSVGQDEHTFDEIVENIGKADVFIAEMTHSSQTLGFQLAHALQLSKPSLCLYDPAIKEKPDGLIGNIPSRNLKIKQLSRANYRKTIDSFTAFAKKQQQSSRTSFMSTREIDEYLSKQSLETGNSKGEIIRELLHKSIYPTDQKDT